MRVFLDANILFSAADPASATRKLLQMLLKKAEAVTNPHAVEEARRNLSVKRPQHVEKLDPLLQKLEVTHAFDREVDAHLPDEDVPILAGATGSHCTHLWTSDRRHFGKYYGKQIGDVTVVSSVMLADILLKQE